MGVFDAIVGLIVGKPERFDSDGAPFGYDDLIGEVVGANRSYPIVTSFDCGHTQPMITIAEMTHIHLTAGEGFDVRMTVEEPMVDVGGGAGG
jgi:muramoyltetrapeptide carboxypeptidase